MPPDTLEFEEPIAVLLKEIEALSMLPSTAGTAAVDRQPDHRKGGVRFAPRSTRR